MRLLTALGLTLSLLVTILLGSTSGRAEDDQVLGREVVRTTDANGRVIEKHIVKKLRARTVVDFEEASIEGSVKKPNAAYLLHGADLDLKHLHRIKSGQRNRIINSYEYVR